MRAHAVFGSRMTRHARDHTAYNRAENKKAPPVGRTMRRLIWLRGLDLNQRPSGYEPDELPGCSTPHRYYGERGGPTQPEMLSMSSDFADHKVAPSGSIRTFDQSVNPDCVGTPALSYIFTFSRRSRISRADFQDLIWRSRRMALERSRCFSDQTKVHGPFLRVNFPPILSVRL